MGESWVRDAQQSDVEGFSAETAGLRAGKCYFRLSAFRPDEHLGCSKHPYPEIFLGLLRCRLEGSKAHVKGVWRSFLPESYASEPEKKSGK